MRPEREAGAYAGDMRSVAAPCVSVLLSRCGIIRSADLCANVESEECWVGDLPSLYSWVGGGGVFS
jgi:hypothetical protein